MIVPVEAVNVPPVLVNALPVTLILSLLLPPFSVAAEAILTTPFDVWVSPAPRFTVPPAAPNAIDPTVIFPSNVTVPAVLLQSRAPVVVKPLHVNEPAVVP